MNIQQHANGSTEGDPLIDREAAGSLLQNKNLPPILH